MPECRLGLPNLLTPFESPHVATRGITRGGVHALISQALAELT